VWPTPLSWFYIYNILQPNMSIIHWLKTCLISMSIYQYMFLDSIDVSP
jgi:hypothetical protein